MLTKTAAAIATLALTSSAIELEGNYTKLKDIPLVEDGAIYWTGMKEAMKWVDSNRNEGLDFAHGSKELRNFRKWLNQKITHDKYKGDQVLPEDLKDSFDNCCDEQGMPGQTNYQIDPLMECLKL